MRARMRRKANMVPRVIPRMVLELRPSSSLPLSSELSAEVVAAAVAVVVAAVDSSVVVVDEVELVEVDEDVGVDVDDTLEVVVLTSESWKEKNAVALSQEFSKASNIARGSSALPPVRTMRPSSPRARPKFCLVEVGAKVELYSGQSS